MTAHELARELLNGPDIPVAFAHPSHDYWGTTLAGEVDRVEEGIIRHTDYHNADEVVDTEAELYEVRDENRSVILLY